MAAEAGARWENRRRSGRPPEAGAGPPAGKREAGGSAGRGPAKHAGDTRKGRWQRPTRLTGLIAMEKHYYADKNKPERHRRRVSQTQDQPDLDANKESRILSSHLRTVSVENGRPFPNPSTNSRGSIRQDIRTNKAHTLGVRTDPLRRRLHSSIKSIMR